MRSGDARLYPPPSGAPRIEVFIVTNFYHSGLIVTRAALAEAARRHSLPELAAVAARFGPYEWLEFGWGSDGFYTRVATNNELTNALALSALICLGTLHGILLIGF